MYSMKENNLRLLKNTIIRYLMFEKIDVARKFLKNRCGYTIGSKKRKVSYDIKILEYGKYNITRKIYTPSKTIVSDTIIVNNFRK